MHSTNKQAALRPNTKLGQRRPEPSPTSHSDEDGRVHVIQIFRKKGNSSVNASETFSSEDFPYDTLWASLHGFRCKGQKIQQKLSLVNGIPRSRMSLRASFRDAAPSPSDSFICVFLPELASSLDWFLRGLHTSRMRGLGGEGCRFYSYWRETLRLVLVDLGPLCSWCALVQQHPLLK